MADMLRRSTDRLPAKSVHTGLTAESQDAMEAEQIGTVVQMLVHRGFRARRVG